MNKVYPSAAAALQGDVDRCFEAGMDGFMAKPIRLAELNRVVGEHLAARADDT